MRSVVMVAACSFPANFGSSASIRELAKILGEREYDVHVVTYPNGDNSMDVGNAKVWRTRSWSKQNQNRTYTGPAWEKFYLDFLMIFTLIRVIRREKIQVIHAHNYEGVLIGLIAKLFTRRPLVYQAVNLMSDELPTYNFIRPAFIARGLAQMLDWIVPLLPDFVIVISKELETYFRARGFDNSRMALIPPGIYPEMFAGADRNRFREQYAVGNRKLVMYTGVSNGFQRIDYLLQSFKVVLKEQPTALLMVVSPLPDEPDLPKNWALAAALGISYSVIWVESQNLDDLPDYLAAADVTVIPRPDIPGYPLKLLNYLAAAKPVVCFNGAAKGVTDKYDALVVPDHDFDAMGRAIATLLRDEDLAQRLAANGHRTVLTHFDWEVLCTEIEGVYSRVLGADRPVRTPELGGRGAQREPLTIQTDSVMTE
jgi:glycosyltransferase involved in cell wall biosynthesis